MDKKSYIVSKVSFNGDDRYVLFEVTPSVYHSVEVGKSFVELMIKIDLRGYDRNEIQFSAGLKEYEY